MLKSVQQASGKTKRLTQMSGILLSLIYQVAPPLAAEIEHHHGIHDDAQTLNHSSVHQTKSVIKPTAPPANAKAEIDHSKMDHSTMDHSKMDHSQMDHSQMKQQPMPEMTHAEHQQATASSEAQELRDPHAYAEGYSFGHLAKHTMGDEEPLASLLMDRLESVNSSRNNGLTYDFQAWYGLTYNRLLVRAEGDINKGSFENARSEVLWAHALTPYWDSQVGIRYDSGRGTDRGWLAFGVQGLAPYWIYVEATGYVNEQGRTSLRLELEYDILITQRLILQPRTELNFYSQSDLSRNIRSGLSDAELGMRLRYELSREFAPYVGVDWEYRSGQDSSLSQPLGQISVSELRFVAGVKFWY